MNNPTLNTAKQFMGKSEEYMFSVFEVAEAIQRIKDSGKIVGLSLVAEDDNVEFVEDVNMVYKALLANEEAEQSAEQTETDDEDDVLEAITFTLKLLSAATAKLIETQAVHDKAIKTLLEGKL